MGERVEKLFQRQHNQLKDSEIALVEQYKGKIARRITHVIDCEAYIFKTKVFYREISVWNITTGTCKSYQIYIPNSSISDSYFAINYQIKKIHGLPIVREKYNDDFYHYYEVLTFLRQEFMQMPI
jgi:hypothetical protein